MDLKTKAPSLLTPAMATLVALLDLAACLFSLAASPLPTMFAVFVLAELFLIALAALQWVIYFRGYVDFRVGQLRDGHTSA